MAPLCVSIVTIAGDIASWAEKIASFPPILRCLTLSVNQIPQFFLAIFSKYTIYRQAVSLLEGFDRILGILPEITIHSTNLGIANAIQVVLNSFYRQIILLIM